MARHEGRAGGAAVVLALRGVPDVPSSAVLKLLRRYARDLRAHGGRLYLADVESRLRAVLHRTGVTEELGDDAVLPSASDLFGAQREAVARARHWARDRPSGPAEG
ncbi:STAS domain-containing protein [Streptomyces sp. cg28]|uniref:STAS domain-containing protein n=1 Tax=Streptomyces sp. cg28 TaxID=3403457 RepID=UPI003B21DDC0